MVAEKLPTELEPFLALMERYKLCVMETPDGWRFERLPMCPADPHADLDLIPDYMRVEDDPGGLL